MMATLPTSLLLATALTFCFVQVHSIDYYWRDFNGTIPADAIPAGLGQNKEQLYVGQAMGNRLGLWAISPIGLSAGRKDYTIPFNSAFTPAETNQTYALKVLCSTQKDNFQWVSTDSGKFPTLKNVVQGGWGNEITTVTPLYVGRSLRFGYSSVGRIQTEFDYFSNNIRYMHEGIQYYADTFDVLTYQD